MRKIKENRNYKETGENYQKKTVDFRGIHAEKRKLEECNTHRVNLCQDRQWKETRNIFDKFGQMDDETNITTM